MKPLKEKVSITLDEDVVAQLRILAEQDDRSFSQYINKVLKEHLAKQKDKQSKPPVEPAVCSAPIRGYCWLDP